MHVYIYVYIYIYIYIYIYLLLVLISYYTNVYDIIIVNNENQIAS